MNINDFIELINSKTGMSLDPRDADKDLSHIDDWDSLNFVYMIVELEKAGSIKLDVEDILACRSLRTIHEKMNDEIIKNKP